MSEDDKVLDLLKTALSAEGGSDEQAGALLMVCTHQLVNILARISLDAADAHKALDMLVEDMREQLQ